MVNLFYAFYGYSALYVICNIPTVTMKIVKFLLGILLIPFCAAATQTVISLTQAVQPSFSSAIPPSALALGGGFLLWMFLYFTLPRPVRTYVLAHELTHALWASIMGARVFRMKISKEKGSVTISKSNFLIMLAPYFFPFYTVLVIIGYYILSIFVDVKPYYLCWLGLVSLTWGFHFTFTLSTLLQHQSDIKECGHLFSYTLIYLLNVMGIGLWIVIVSAATLEQMVEFMKINIGSIAVLLWKRIAGFL